MLLLLVKLQAHECICFSLVPEFKTNPAYGQSETNILEPFHYCSLFFVYQLQRDH
jgi:hypothetical protein